MANELGKLNILEIFKEDQYWAYSGNFNGLWLYSKKNNSMINKFNSHYENQNNKNIDLPFNNDPIINKTFDVVDWHSSSGSSDSGDNNSSNSSNNSNDTNITNTNDYKIIANKNIYLIDFEKMYQYNLLDKTKKRKITKLIIPKNVDPHKFLADNDIKGIEGVFLQFIDKK